MKPEEKHYKRILLILLGRLGDYIVTTPFLEGLRKRCPGAAITLITSRKAAGLACGNPDLDQVVVFQGWHHPPSTLRMLIAAWRRCDLAIDLNPAYSRASLSLMRLSRAPERLAFEKAAPAGAYTAVIPHDLEQDHFMEKYVILAERLGFTPPESMRVTLQPDILAEGRRLVAGLGFPPGNRVIAIHPGNFKKHENRWPEEKFVEFTRGLLELKGVSPFYLVGLGEERETREGILRHLPGVKQIPPKSQELTAAILRSCAMLVCNSTGTLHLAAAAGVPTFSFNRPYTEKCWKPKGRIHAFVTSKSQRSCRDIEVADALRAFGRALADLKP
jgi:ADP-heptose:LPS heptosyltransferase